MRADLDAIFERAPGLADRLTALVPVDATPEQIVDAARAVIATLPEAERIGILDAHPRIGADPASLSALSRAEQGAGDDVVTLRELARLNDEYERHFGFRFVVFVAGRSRAEIVPVLRARLARSRDEELATGIAECLRISLDRLRSTTDPQQDL